MSKEKLGWISRNLNKVKVIYTDMDGTLVGTDGSLFTASGGSYTLAPARAIKKVLEARVDVVIVSGRSYLQLKENARILGFKNFIAELGCEIVYELGERVIYNIGNIPLRKGQKPVDVIEKTGATELLFSAFPDRLRYYTPWSRIHNDTVLLVGNIDIEEANRVLEENKLSDLLRIIDNGGVSPEPDFPSPHSYHLMPRAAGKAQAIKKDKQLRGLCRKELVGIGESIEDMEIAPEVGAFFVVRNGVDSEPRIKEIVKDAENIFILDEAMGSGWEEMVDLLVRLGKIR